MARVFGFVLFITLALSILVLAHYYLWVRLVRDPLLPRQAALWAKASLVGLGLSIPLTFWASRALPPGPGRFFLLASYSWLGLLLFLVFLLLGGELVRLALGLYERMTDAPIVAERRLALTRLLAAATSLGALAMGIAALRKGSAGFIVKTVEISLDRLKPSTDGFTIVQLTDLHIGPTLQDSFLRDVVRKVNELEPDLVAITGDLVDGSVEHLAPIVARLKELRSRHGTFFVTGNHEYYSGAAPWVSYLKTLGVTVLENQRVTIHPGDDAFFLAGVNDHSAAHTDPLSAPDYERALGGADPKLELILLAHQPKAVFEAERYGVGLMLSGHTHGGQIWPWNHLVPLQQPVIAGLERIGKVLVYVSSGTGYWGPPMRLGTSAEITRIVLRGTTPGARADSRD